MKFLTNFIDVLGKMPDVILSQDGSVSLTKLAAATFHFQLAVWVGVHTYLQGFNMEVWGLYGGFAVGHAAYDKTATLVAVNRKKAADIKVAEIAEGK